MNGPVLRIFEVKTKPNCRDKLLENFATTSAGVVKNQPGNCGYLFGDCIQSDLDIVMFVSVWQTLDAVKARFGDDWQTSFLPEGYDNLIDECRLLHLNASAGWHVSTTPLNSMPRESGLD